jgi:hypothetical protein
MTKYIHVNRQVIDANRKHGRSDPALTARVGKRGKAVYSNDVQIVKDGIVVARFRADFQNPILPCGARVVVETDCEVWANGHEVK